MSLFLQFYFGKSLHSIVVIVSELDFKILFLSLLVVLEGAGQFVSTICSVLKDCHLDIIGVFHCIAYLFVHGGNVVT